MLEHHSQQFILIGFTNKTLEEVKLFYLVFRLRYLVGRLRLGNQIPRFHDRLTCRNIMARDGVRHQFLSRQKRRHPENRGKNGGGSLYHWFSRGIRAISVRVGRE